MSKSERKLCGGIDIYDERGSIKCEIDGEPLAGVHYVVTELDRDGDPCIMIFTDPILSAHVSAQIHPKPFNWRDWLPNRDKKIKKQMDERGDQ